MNKSPKSNLRYVVDTLRLIDETRPVSKAEFLADRNIQDATLMRLQDIGEQLSRIRDNSPDFYEKHHNDAWNRLIGLRNIISHGYREIEFEIIWDIIAGRLEKFENQVNDLL